MARTPTSIAGSEAIRRRRASGFTLLELIVVVFLIGVGTALAFAAFDRVFLSRQATQWPEELAFQLKRLRAKAISSGVIVNAELRLDTGELLWTDRAGLPPLLKLPPGYAFDVPIDSSMTNGEPATKTVVGPTAPKLIDGAARIVFYPDGSVGEMRFHLLMPKDRVTRFWLRGLTGKIQVDEIGDKI